MTPKLLEVRDAATFIPVLAVSISSADGYLAQRAGFGNRCIQLIHITSGRSAYDPYEWTNRTMRHAHEFIESNWDEVNNEDVIDVQFILGETPSPKRSERFE